MTGENFFLVVAQVSIAIAGFTAVILSLSNGQNRPWQQNDKNALHFMLEFSLAGVLIGLLPSFSSFYFTNKTDEYIIWMSLSYGLALFFLIEIVINACRAWRASPRHPYLLYGLF